MENDLYTAKSAAARAGCDPGTVKRQCKPIAYVQSSTTGREFPVYAQDEVEALAAWIADHGRGCKHKSRKRAR